MRLAKAHSALEHAARTAYGRLVATLSVRTRDIALAEEAISEAFVAALESWPRNGIPDRPEAWLLAVARRRAVSGHRHREVGRRAEEALLTLWEELQSLEPELFADRRLALLFVCSHPGVDPSVRAPLMMQVVLGLTAQQVASAFLLAPKTVGQRLWRAKRWIRDSGLSFELPAPEELRTRLGDVLEAIYGAYQAGSSVSATLNGTQSELRAEAVYLAELVTEMLADQAEAHGLLALLQHLQARRSSRPASDVYIPLRDQDVKTWNLELIRAGEKSLHAATELRTPGRFQIEAAIQSAHNSRAFTGVVDRSGVVRLYEALLRVAPTPGARVAYAAALLEDARASDAEVVLSSFTPEQTDRFQAYWAVRAHVLDRLSRKSEADQAYGRAIGLCSEPAVRCYLSEKRAKLF